MIEQIRKQVYEVLKDDNSGHGMEHIDRVYKLSIKFAKEEKANMKIVALAALLHDVDDYKLFGKDSAEKLTNAKRILTACNIKNKIQEPVLEIIKTMGYSKLLQGIRPTTIEGQIVSDADMCDAIGANGILRTYAYNIKNNRPFFDRNNWPTPNITAKQYTKNATNSSVNHMFEKILKLKDLMFTDSGSKEAIKRHETIISFLYQFFMEEDAYDWIAYLDAYNVSEEV